MDECQYSGLPTNSCAHCQDLEPERTPRADSGWFTIQWGTFCRSCGEPLETGARARYKDEQIVCKDCG